MFKSKTKGDFLLSDMKICAYRSVQFIGLLMLLYACTKEENSGNKPHIQLVDKAGYISSDTTISAGKRMHFKVLATQSDYPLTNFFIEVTNLEGDIYRLFDTAFYLPEIMWEGSFFKSSEKYQNLVFVIQDRQSNRKGEFLRIYTDTVSFFNPVESMESIIMGAQDNGESGGFYSLGSQQVFFLQDAKENQPLIDLVFYFGEDELTLASPGANIESGIFQESLSPVNWATRNTTRFIKTGLTPEDFNNTINDSIMITKYIDADGKRKVKVLAAGDIYVFKNQQNRLGMFRVNQASGTFNGQVDIDIKIQKQGK